MIQHDNRHLDHAEAFGSCDQAMSGDNDAIVANQDGIDESELGNRCGDLSDLFVRVCASVSKIRREPSERPFFDDDRV
jgi:hypothetical protein